MTMSFHDSLNIWWAKTVVDFIIAGSLLAIFGAFYLIMYIIYLMKGKKW